MNETIKSILLLFVVIIFILFMSYYVTSYGCTFKYWANDYWRQIAYECHFP